MIHASRYFLAAVFSGLFVCYQAAAQSPGGVSGCELWYRTESVTDDLHADYHYRDFSGDTTRLLYLRDGVWKEFRQQKSHIRTYNFHPALNLSVTHPDTAKISRLRRSDLSQCTIVGVFGPRSSGLTSDRLLYGVDARPGKGFLVSKTKAFHGYHPDTIGYSANNIGNLLSGLSSPSAFREQALRVLSYHRSTAPTTGVWSAVGQEATLIQGVGSVTGASSIQTAFGSLLNPLGAFDGYTPEMIVYARKLTPFEQVQISSYLSIALHKRRIMLSPVRRENRCVP